MSDIHPDADQGGSLIPAEFRDDPPRRKPVVKKAAGISAPGPQSVFKPAAKPRPAPDPRLTQTAPPVVENDSGLAMLPQEVVIAPRRKTPSTAFLIFKWMSYLSTAVGVTVIGLLFLLAVVWLFQPTKEAQVTRDLVGTWTLVCGTYEIDLKLDDDGTYLLNSKRGGWSVRLDKTGCPVLVLTDRYGLRMQELRGWQLGNKRIADVRSTFFLNDPELDRREFNVSMVRVLIE